MTGRSRAIYSRVVAGLAAAIASVLASVALPTAVITIYAMRARNVELITSFAQSVAEPLGLLGAAAATFGIARFMARRTGLGRSVIPWIGGAAAGSMVGAAFWVGDVDGWTAAAALVLPATAMLAARRSPALGAGGARRPIAAPADVVAGARPAPEPVDSVRGQ